MKEILIAAVNARYSHASLGARFLLANMGELRDRTELLEFNISQAVESIAEQIIRRRPRVVGIGVYIWNRGVVEQLVCILGENAPAMKIVLGGPEISYDNRSSLAQRADCVICGEGERSWPEICGLLLAGEAVPRIVAAAVPDPADILLPDAEYSADDLAHRNVYFEASRGCPYACDFCLSSAVAGVRHFPEEEVFAALTRLLERGCCRIRFVDRSFNLGGRRAEGILEYFLQRLREGMRLHFEMTPDGLGTSLRALIRRFPPGVLHIETGVQSFDADVLAAVNRDCDPARAAEGIAWLVHEARADVHADLIAGLPGETPDSFAAGFDRLYRIGPAEIQVGLLKLLHGTAMGRNAAKQELVFSKTPPYEIIETATMSSGYIHAVRRYAAHWERIANRGHFAGSVSRMLGEASSPWTCFDAFSRKLAELYGLYGIGLVEAAGCLYSYMTEECAVPADEARELLRNDYLDGGRRMNLPAFLVD